MKINRIRIAVISVLLLVAVLGLSSWSSPGTIVPLQQPTGTPSPAPNPTPGEKSWILVDLPPDATQLEYGTEVYRLVCKACHGDKGQGLTDDWRAQWAPSDQNCWQSKCHALNHPSDGFYMPQVPAVKGLPLVMFADAQALHDYIQKYMPWHDPDSMTAKDTWSVTAYILKLNQVDPGPFLSPETAGQIDLRAARAQQDQQAQQVQASPAPAQKMNPTAIEAVPSQALEHAGEQKLSPYWWAAILALIVLASLGVIFLARRLAARSDE
jgi:cytochrome c5